MEFKWKEIDINDYECYLDNDYYLRVEQMDKGIWWWNVSRKNNEVYRKGSNQASSKNRAMGLCEGVYLMHSINNR